MPQGRPKLPDGERKDYNFTICVKEKERHEIKKFCYKNGYSINQFFTKLFEIVKQIRVQENEDIFDVIRQRLLDK